jgi:DNA repair exonuclease SbcCD ATPase subunit
MPVPSMEDELISNQSEINTKLQTLEQTNKKITKNNTYRQIQGNLKLFPIPTEPVIEDLSVKKAGFVKEQVENNKIIKDSQAFIKKMNGLSGTCPTCLQAIDETKIATLLAEQEELQTTAIKKIDEINNVLEVYKQQELKMAAETSEWNKAIKAKEEWEKYHSLIDETLPEELLDQNDLQRQFDDLQHKITELKSAIAKVEKHNREADAHNTKVEIVSKQLVEMNEDLEKYSGTMHELSEKMGLVNILSKTFSTTGLVAYKIECLVKDLEELTNQYLVDLSDGRFQIAFRISSSDKLNVVITDNSKDIDNYNIYDDDDKDID